MIADLKTRLDPFVPRNTLNETEKVLLELLARGFTAEQIAHELDLTPSTVGKYFVNLRLKMEARDNTQLIAYALSSKKKKAELKKDPFTSRQTLSETERAIIELLARGWTAREIAEHKRLNFRTVERHIETLRLKMNARNVAHLVAISFAKKALKVVRGTVKVSG